MIVFRSHRLVLALAFAAPSFAAAPQTVAKPAAKAGAGNVTRAQMVAQSKAIFARADTNHDGFMSRAEFAARMAGVINANQPATQAEAQQMLDAANRAFDDADTNRDGKLSIWEGIARPLKAFDMMDANHDGILTLAEKRAAHQEAPSLRPIGPQPDGPTGR